MIRWTLLVLSALALTGCGYEVFYTPMNNPVSPTGEVVEASLASRMPISPSEVTLFLTQRPTGPYRELGIISIPTYQSVPEQEAILQLFRDQAAAVGADGVILLNTENKIDSFTTPTYIYDYGVIYQETIRSRSIFRGMAIQFTE